MFFIPTNLCLTSLAISSPLSIITPHVNVSVHQPVPTDYLIPRTRTKLGERLFSVAGPTTWNSVPETVLAITDKTAFKRIRRTNFLNFAFNSSSTLWHCNATSVWLIVYGALNTALLLILLLVLSVASLCMILFYYGAKFCKFCCLSDSHCH